MPLKHFEHIVIDDYRRWSLRGTFRKIYENIIEYNEFKPLLEKLLNSYSDVITDYLKKESRIFPSIFSRMIGVGEETGSLENSLFYLADFYEKEVDSATKNLSTILEPILLVIIGLVVVFVAISIISPIYELTRGLRV